MEGLPTDICVKIFCTLDHQNLATVQLVCRRWNCLASDNNLWSHLFKERWGSDRTTFYAPLDSSRSWKYVYEVQDRCDRVGLELKIIREGIDYYLVHQGEIQRHLGTKQQQNGTNRYLLESELGKEESTIEEPNMGILDRILFFIGDLETASSCAKRS